MGEEYASRLRATYSAMGGVGEPLLVTVPGVPRSKTRPRYTRKGHVYQNPTDREREERTAWFLRGGIREPFGSNVAVVCMFVRPNRTRVDADNMVKHVLDAANGVIFEDDRQVTAQAGLVEMDAENPRTVIAIGAHQSSLDRTVRRTVPCAQCGSEVERVGGVKKKRQFCSRKCRNEFFGHCTNLEVPIPCAACGDEFRRKTESNKYCSRECANKGRAATMTKDHRPMACADCGLPTSSKRAVRCRECWLARKRATARCEVCGARLAKNYKRCRECWRTTLNNRSERSRPRPTCRVCGKEVSRTSDTCASCRNDWR